MFYTKYRPQTFREICRPNEAADSLSKQISGKKTGHAYLFVGPRGTGKTTIARLLAKALNCENIDKTGDPCDKCDFCVSIKHGNFPDLIEIDAASNRGIDDIRDLKDKINLAPSMGKTKVYIIDEVHMLTSEAFNALLKTLEEPPANVTFILCTTEFQKVPETIKSRCQVFKFKRATLKQLSEKLEKIAKQEKIKISDEDLKKIAQASLGGFRDAETLLEQVSSGDINIDSLIGSSSKSKFIEFTEFLINRDSGNALRFVDTVFDEGFDLYVWVGELLKYFREILYIKSNVEPDYSDYSDELKEDVKAQSKKISVAWLLNSITIFVKYHKEIKGAFIQQMPVEIAVIEVCGSSESEKGNEIHENSKNSDSEEEFIKKDDLSPKNEEGPVVVKNEKTSEEKKKKEKKLELNIDEVNNNWKEFLRKSKDLNHSITALLNSGRVVNVEGNVVVLEVSYRFHKERLESARNRRLIEDLLSEVYSKNLSIKCVLSEEKPIRLRSRETGVLTDMNIAVPSGIDREALLAAFDGGLPL